MGMSARSIRTRRSRRRRGRRTRRQTRRRLLVAVGAGLLCLLVLATSLILRYVRAEAGGQTCVEVIGADRSGSQDARAVSDRWRAEAKAVIDRAAGCEGTVIAEAIYDRPGKGEIVELSLHVKSRNWLDKEQKLRERSEQVESRVREVLTQPAEGPTNLIDWFDRVGNHVEDIPGAAVVNLTLFTDGINSMEPVNMLTADLSPEGVARLIDRIRPSLPDCTGWQIRILGVNTTSTGGVDRSRAEGAERFWRAFVNACGGTLRKYDTAAQGA